MTFCFLPWTWIISLTLNGRGVGVLANFFPMRYPCVRGRQTIALIRDYALRRTWNGGTAFLSPTWYYLYNEFCPSYRSINTLVTFPTGRVEKSSTRRRIIFVSIVQRHLSSTPHINVHTKRTLPNISLNRIVCPLKSIKWTDKYVNSWTQSHPWQSVTSTSIFSPF